MRKLRFAMLAACAAAAVEASPGRFAPAERGVAADIAKAIADTPDGGVVQLPDGRVFLESPVEINGRTNLTVRGGRDTVVVLHYSPWGHPVWDHSPRFFIRNCIGVTFENIRVTTDNPVNASGRVVAKNPEDGTYEAEIDPQFPITGWEHFFASDSFDDDGTPDYVLATYDYRYIRTKTLPDGKGGERKKTVALAYEVVGPQRIRVRASASALERLRIGQRVLYRYTVYGHSVFQIVASRDTVLRDIEIERCPSFGVDVLPPSANLTLERFNIRVPEGDHALYAANADGIHILGLSGRFTMRDCHFLGLGDDALNIHAKSGEIAVFDSVSGALKVICRNTSRKEVPLPRNWMAVGDTLAVHDSMTFLEKGRMVVTRFEGAGSAAVRIVDGSAAVGDFVANTRDMPSVEIEDCSVERTRARGFLLQSSHMRVRDCTFRCLSLPGIIIAPDFRGWFEAGPAEDVEISGCTFEKCGMNGTPANRGAITVKTSHGDSLDDIPAGVHRDIRVFGNTFRNCGAAGVFIASASGVEVRDNVFENGWRNPPPNADPERSDVLFFHCDGIVSTATEPAAFVLAERGKEADCAIVIPADAAPPVRYAAEELRDFTEKTTGVRLPIVARGTGNREQGTGNGECPQILIVHKSSFSTNENANSHNSTIPQSTNSAFSASLRLCVKKSSPDSFRLKAEGGRLHIVGGGPSGVLYGVYEVLERFAGCHWYASWHTIAPQRERIEVPADLDETHEPAFEMREPFWYDVRENQDFAARLRVNSRSWLTFDEKYGGNPYRFGGDLGSCHTFDTLLPPTKYFDAHPEYFSMVKGRRVKDRTQLCLTNPDVLRIVTSNVLERIRKDPGAKFYGVSQNDWFNFCECPNCKAVDDEEGSHAGTMVRFVNAIAEAVEKEFPDAIIETLAYQYTRKAPTKTKLRHNVVPCLCTIECDFARPLDESGFKENVSFRKDIEDWSRLTDFLYVWDYTTDFGHYLLPWANVYALQGNLRFFRRHNVKAIFEQGAFQGRHADFAELKAWLLAKWMWNPDLPMEPLLDDFFAGYYGKSAPFVREYFEKLHRLQLDYSKNPEHPLLIFDGVENPALSDSFLEEAAELWAKAIEAVKDDPATSYNVRMGAMSVDYARLQRANRLLNFTESAMPPERARALAQSLLDRMAEAKHVRLAEADRSDMIVQWQKIAEGKVVLGKSESGELEDCFLPITNRGKWGDHVDDPKADDGRALKLFNTHFQWCVQLSMSSIAFEPGRKYRLSMRVRVDRAGDGEAFWAGVYSKGASRGRGGIEPRTTDIPDSEYHWYDVLEWIPAPDEYFWIGPGRFDKDGKSAINAVWIDKIAFHSVDEVIQTAAATSASLPGENILWPSEETELRAQPDSTLVTLPDGAREVRTGVEFAYPGVRMDFLAGESDLSSFGRVIISVSNTTDRMETVQLSVKGETVQGQTPGGSVRLAPHATGEIRVDLKNMPWALDAPLGLVGMRGFPKAPGDGSTFDLRRVRSFHIFLKQDGKPGGFAVRRIAASSEGAEQKILPSATFLPFVDQYGQFAHDDWPGKVHNDADLAAAREAEAAWLAENAAGPIPDIDQYGGWAGGPQLEATGFFRTEKVNGKWWLVDPEGHLFFSHGVNAVTSSAETGVGFRENYFAWLPAKDDPQYGSFWSVRKAPEAHGFYKDPAHLPFDKFDFAKANARRKYGSDWERDCAERTHARMRVWGLNTIASWSSVAIREMRRTPYTAKFNTRGPVIEGSTGWWGKLRDPFAPEFASNVCASAAEAAAQSGEDPWCVGWFVDNELSWGSDNREIGRAVLRSPATQPAKVAARDLLAAKYGTAEALDAAWGTQYGSWDAFLAATNMPDEVRCGQDLADIHRAAVAKYFSTVRDAIKAVAPNRLYLGCRIAWGRDVVYEECARYADVVSVNAYGRPPMRDLPPTAIDKPMLSGEFHFGALDRGMFHTGLVATRDQNERADCYRAYVGACLDHPRYVGTHWFQWMDQALTGRGDGENYQIGFVTVTDAPYPELVRAARDIAATMYQRRFGKRHTGGNNP